MSKNFSSLLSFELIFLYKLRWISRTLLSRTFHYLEQLSWSRVPEMTDMSNFLIKIENRNASILSFTDENIRIFESWNKKTLLRKNRKPVLANILHFSLSFQFGLYFSDLEDLPLFTIPIYQ